MMQVEGEEEGINTVVEEEGITCAEMMRTRVPASLAALARGRAARVGSLVLARPEVGQISFHQSVSCPT